MSLLRSPEWFSRLTDRVLPRTWGTVVRERPAVLVALGLVGVAVLMRLNNGVRYPALHGYDGFGHATYIWYLLKNHQIPLAHEGWEHFHPPLYYALCAGIWSVLRAIEPKQVLKVISVTFSLLGLASALVSYAVARRYFPQNRVARFLAPAFVLFLPAHIYTAPMLGNESLNTVLCSLALYLLLRTVQTERLALAVALGIVLGLGMLTKATSLLYVATSGLVIVLWGLHRRRWRLAFTQLCVVGALVLAVSGWFYVRNVQVYGTPFQMGRQYFFNQHIERSLATGRRGLSAYLTFDRRIFSDPMYVAGPVLDSVWTGAFATTWFDAHGNWFLPSARTNPTTRLLGRVLLILGVVPTMLVFVGLLSGLRRLWREGWDDVLAVMFVAMGAIAAMFMAYTFDNRIFTAVKASYMMPAIVPFSFWFALGVDAVLSWGWVARLLTLAELLLLVAVIIPVYTYQLLFEAPLGRHHWNAMAVIDHFAGFRDRARSTFEALANGYDFYLAHENWGSLALEDGEVHKALFEFREAMRWLPSQVMGVPADREQLITLTRADYFNSLAVIYDRLGWVDEALHAARQAVALDPSLPEAHYDLAVLMIKQGWPDAAVGTLERAIELDPGFADAHLLLGVAQQRAGDCTRARDTLEYATAVHTWPRRAYSHVTGMGDQDDAAIVRRRTITHLPPSVNADYALAVCRASANDVAPAGHDLAQALATGRLPAGALADDAWRRVAGGSLVPLVLPNIVVVMIDTLRADHVGAYGYARPTTPNLDALAARGVRFSNAFSTSSWTRPAVASLFTGLFPSRHEVVTWQAPLRADVPTLAEELAKLGYYTAAFSANFVAVGKYGHFNRGFIEFKALSVETKGDEYSLNHKGHRLRAYDAREMTDAVTRWLHNTPQRPMFLYVHYLDPHPGYQPPEADARLFGATAQPHHQGTTADDITKLEVSGAQLAAPELQYLIDLYDGEIHFTDAQVAELLDQLERADICGNCVVVAVADHGEEFQDHGHFWHAFTLYDEMIRIPMIFHARGTWNFGPRVVGELVQITDLFPTLIEMAGGVAPANIDGRSLLPLLRNEDNAARDSVVAELSSDPVVDKLVHPKRHQLAVREAREKLIVAPDGRSELYRTDTDPAEQHNVAASQGGEVERLLALADGHRLVPTSAGGDAQLSAGQREQMRALGYLP